MKLKLNVSKTYVPLLVVLALSLVLHLGFLIKDPGSVFNDPKTYGEAVSTYGSLDASKYSAMAWQLIRDGVYGYDSDQPNAYVTPGQPFYLAAIFKVADVLHTNHVMLVRVANLILSVATSGLIYLIALKLFRRVATATVASLLYATYFSQFHYFRTMLTEVPSIFLFSLTILLFVIACEKQQMKWHVLFGIVSCITLMFRPAPAPLLLVAAGIVLYRFGIKTSFKIGMLWLIGPALVFGPWIIRNFVVLDTPYVFSSGSGNPLLAGTDPFDLEGFDAISQKAAALGLSEGDYAKLRIKEGFIQHFDLWFAWFTVGKTIWLFKRPDGIPLYWWEFPQYAIYFTYIQHLLVTVGGVLSGLLLRKNKTMLALLLLTLCFIGVSDMFLTIPRYGMFILPAMALMSAHGLVVLSSKIKVLARLPQLLKK